jgi:adenosine deaminase
MSTTHKPLDLYDLHVHYGGSIPAQTVWEILKEDGHNFATLDEVITTMTYHNDNGPYTFEKFLRKFDILNMIRWTEAHIIKSTDAVVKMLADQDTKYAEIRFTINKYADYLGMTNKEIIIFMCKQMQESAKRFNIKVAPILCVKYESARDSQADILKLIDDHKVADVVDGIDLVGDEKFFNVDFYKPIFKQWKRAHKGLIAHVGESQTVENVIHAIKSLHVNRISHGIKIADDIEAIKIANDHGIAFDVALTSNIKTGVTPNLHDHPVKRMIENGCVVSLGTDDPAVLNTTLSNEYNIAYIDVGLSRDTIMQMKQNAINSALR